MPQRFGLPSLSNLIVKEFFDQETSTLSYCIHNKIDGVVIDPVLSFDPFSGKTDLKLVHQILDYVESNKLAVPMVLDTHVHADHLTGAWFIKQSLPGAKYGIGAKVGAVQKTFNELLQLDVADEGQQFDLLLNPNEIYTFNSLNMLTIDTPGHTPACTSYKFGEHLFVGDTIFMPDFGTGRCDFPGGDPRQLYETIQTKIYSLLDETKVYVGHDYQPGGRRLEFVASVGNHKRENEHIKSNTSETEFVEFRTQRDKELAIPNLFYPSIQVNICGGQIPNLASGEFLKMPIHPPEL